MVMSAPEGAVMVVGSVALSFAVFSSPPPEIETEFVALAGAEFATLRVKVIGGYDAAAASESLRAQLSVPSVQTHPVPEIAVAVIEDGSTSTTEIAAVVLAPPMLVAVIV